MRLPQVIIGYIVIVLILLSTASAPAAAAAQSLEARISLYAHSPLQGIGAGPILNALPDWTGQRAAPIQKEEAVFTQVVPLGGSVSLDGLASIQLYIRADGAYLTVLSVYVSELAPNGTSIPLFRPIIDTETLGTSIRQLNYLLTISNTPLVKGSMIQLHVSVQSPTEATGIYVMYDSPDSPTQITLPTHGSVSVTSTFLDSNGVPANVFNVSGASRNASLAARVAIADYFGLGALRQGKLNLRSSNGNIISTVNDLLAQNSSSKDAYGEVIETRLDAPQGEYALTVSLLDASGNSYSSTSRFYVAAYHEVSVRVVDSSNMPLNGAQITASLPVATYAAKTNLTGWAKLAIPDCNVVGQYQLYVLWKSKQLSVGRTCPITGTPIRMDNVFDVAFTVRLSWSNLPDATVDLISNSTTVDSRKTNGVGEVSFNQIPAGNYTLRVRYFWIAQQVVKDIPSRPPSPIVIRVPFPYEAYLPYFLATLAVAAILRIVLKSRRTYEAPFDHLNCLAGGSFPASITTTIIGRGGSGKSVLLQSILCQRLLRGHPCVYVTNVELPSDVRNSIRRWEIDPEAYESKGMLHFIDCYSALSGVSSKEKKSIGSFSDLTSLGIIITSTLGESGEKTDVFIDSLTPLFSALRPDRVMDFLQSTGANIKTRGGNLWATLSTTVDSAIIARVEETADCVVETELVDTRGRQKRRLRIKKLRGHPYLDAWTGFRIDDERGVVFVTRRRCRRHGGSTSYT